MRRNGAIPPGRLGLIVIAAAFVPLAIRKFRPAVRWLGKRLVSAGETVKRVADEADREAERARPAAPKTESTVKEEIKESPATPAQETVSPHGHVELDAQRAKSQAKPAKKTATAKKPKQPLEGAAPPASNPKRARKKSG